MRQSYASHDESRFAHNACHLNSKAAASLSYLIKFRGAKDLLDSQGGGPQRGKHGHESSITVLSLRGRA